VPAPHLAAHLPTDILVRRCAIFTKDDLELVARFTPSHLAQKILYQNADTKIRLQLILNPQLSPHIWDKLYKTTTSAQTWDEEHRRRAELPALLTNAPTEDRAAKVLKQREDQIIKPALERGIKNISAADALALSSAKRITPEYACLLLTSRVAPERSAKRLFEIVRSWAKNSENSTESPDLGSEIYGESLIAISSHYELLTPEEVVALLDELEEVNLLYISWVGAILDYRPDIAPLLLGSKHFLSYSDDIARSQYITPELAVNLLDTLKAARDLTSSSLAQTLELISLNPSVPYSLRHRALVEIKRQRLNYSMSKDELNQRLDSHNTAAQLGLSEIKGGWQNATTEQLPDLYRILSQRSWNYPTLYGASLLDQDIFPGRSNLPTRSYITDTLTPYLDKLGATGWELFINLLPEWAGPIDTLLSVITSTTLVH